MSKEKKPSPAEGIKEKSLYLKGDIADELDSDTLAFSNESAELMKYHGSYQGYNRDTARARKKQGLDKEHELMLRFRLTAGLISAESYLELNKMADTHSNGTLRITSRQTLQFHHIAKKNMKSAIAGANSFGISTIGACGDVVRNVITSPAPINDFKHKRLRDDTFKIAEYCLPKTSSYAETWLGQKESNRDSDNLESLYGELYLPRKFKIGLIIPEDNCIDVFTHDLGLVLISEGNEVKGYNVYLGGGLGMTHNKAATYPRLASAIAFVPEDKLLQLVEAVVLLHKDHGDRSDRKHARLKYVVEENGIVWTRKTLEEYYGEPLLDPVEIDSFGVVDHTGWHEQGDGKYYLGIAVSSGRIQGKIRSALREVIAKYRMDIVFTANQNIILKDIKPEDRGDITSLLERHGIKLAEDLSNLERNCITCVALPTCGKALAESERITKPIMKAIEELLAANELIEERISVRIAGCPNGCSRAVMGDIGIIGRMPGHYTVRIGGDFEGTRMNVTVFDKVPEADIIKALTPMIRLYAMEKLDGEGFGDFAYRYGVEKITADAIEVLAGYKWAKVV